MFGDLRKGKTMGKSTNARAALGGGDWIHLRDIQTRCVLGVYPAERKKPRKVRLDVSMECDARSAAKSDELADALNYEEIEAETIAVAKKGKFFLIETLAEKVAEACLKHAPVRTVRVVVDKPGALARTRSVAVEIVRSK